MGSRSQHRYIQNPRLDYAAGMRTRSRKVMGYLRVSTEEQAMSGLGLSDQKMVIAREASRRGWDDLTFVSDDGYSAENLARPGISAVLDQMQTGGASLLVVAKLDRLSRSLLDFATLMDRARREGWELVVLDLALDTTTPSGQLMANVMASFAEYERRLIGQRTSAALQMKKAQGARLGRPRTMDSAVTNRIVTERAAGRSFANIASGLQTDGVPTTRGGRQWYPATISAVLKSVALDQATTAA